MPTVFYVCNVCGVAYMERDKAVACEGSHDKVCANPDCGKTFVTAASKRLYCCEQCRNLARQRRHRGRQKEA